MLTAAVATFAIAACGAGSSDRELLAAGEAPNVIILMVDDQELGTFNRHVMPRTFDLVDERGGSELRGHALPPLCCPDRAGMMTGQYPHNHGVLQNDWALLDQPDNLLPDWLRAAGYRTGFTGKYMNGYTPSPKPASGFDSWYELSGKAGYYDYNVSDQGTLKPVGHDREDYSTTAITRENEKFIADSADHPFFLWTSYYAPHDRKSDDPHCGQDAPTPLHQDWLHFKDEPVKLPPSFNEADMSDKPSRIINRKLPRNYAQIAKQRLRCTMAAMQEVDRGVGSILDQLDELGIQDDTAIFYVSDNGYFFGEHRIKKGKYFPYLDAIRVPMLAKIPPQYLNGEELPKVPQPVANIDIAPTILDLADTDACRSDGRCRVPDGRSMLAVLSGDDPTWTKHRPLLSELSHKCLGFGSVLRGDEIYSEWREPRDGDCKLTDRELYELKEDPYQLENRLADPSAEDDRRAARLSRVLDRLSDCSGAPGETPADPDLHTCG